MERIRPIAFKPDGWESHMTIIGIETLAFEYFTDEQAPVEAAMALGHD